MDEFGGIPVDEPQTDEFGGIAVAEPPKSWTSKVFTSPLGPGGKAWIPPSPDQSLIGISPDLVPRGTTLATSALSAVGKTAAGIGQFITSPQGMTEVAAAATPAAPAIMAKWAYDMIRGGYKSTKAIVDELGQMTNEAFNKGIITHNQLGPIPEGTTTQEHIQSLAENAANAVAMGLGVTALASHGVGGDKVTPKETITPEATPEAEKGVPAGESGEPPPTAPATVAAKEEGVAATSTEPAKVEPNATGGVTQPELTGLGGALKEGEIPETGAGGEKYGIAERVRAERAQAGQVAPVEPGKGMSPQQTIEMGREIVRRDPEAPTRIMSAFEADPKKAISTEGISVVRAHGESLAAGARTIEEQFGTMSPQYEQAQEVLSDWDKRTKKMQTEWHKQGQAQQGETDIDTGSFTGLERARKQATGQRIPAAKKPKAEKIAADNKKAQQEVGKAQARLNHSISKRSDAEKAAFDAANKTVREAAARRAQAENKARVAEVERQHAIRQVQEDAKAAAQEAVNKVTISESIRKAREENKSRAKEAQRKKEIAENERRVAQKAVDRSNKMVRDAAANAAKEARRRLGDPSIAVWELAKKYLDENKGLYGFDDLRNKIATDLKMSPSRVTKWMARDATTKRLATDLWAKQRNARRLKEQAKNWLRELDTPGYQKALASIPNAMFSLSVFGHGFVALGTHAPIVAFQPRFWNAYVRNFGKMYKLVFSPSYYEAQMQDLVRRPNYDLARRSGLQNDPFKYEEFHTTAIKDLVKDWIGEKNMERIDKFAGAGNRGYGVLKLLRQDMFDQRYNKLPDSVRNQEGVTKGIADGVNHATGVTAKQAPKGSNILLFAPRLEGSRVMWIGGDPARATAAILNWDKTTEAERQFAKDQMKEKAWVFGTFASLLAMNQGFLAAAGSKQKINGIPEALGGAGFDPLASDFLKFKALGGDIAYGGALLTMTKLPLRVGWAIYFEGKGSKYVLEDERVGKVLFSYARSQMSPFAGTVTDTALGRDYQERPLPSKLFGAVEQTGDVPKRLKAQGIDEPYTWSEFAATKLPIPIAEGIKEGLKGSGMNDEQANYWMRAWAITTLMTATGTRISEDTREE